MSNANPIQKFRQSYIVFEKLGILSEIWKFWRAPTTLQFNIFCLNVPHVFYLPVSTKGCAGFFCYFAQILSYLQKFQSPGFYTLVFYIFINNSRPKQNKKYPARPFVGIIKACVRYFLSNFYFFTKWYPSKTMKNVFYFI